MRPNDACVTQPLDDVGPVLRDFTEDRGSDGRVAFQRQGDVDKAGLVLDVHWGNNVDCYCIVLSAWFHRWVTAWRQEPICDMRAFGAGVRNLQSNNDG